MTDRYTVFWMGLLAAVLFGGCGEDSSESVSVEAPINPCGGDVVGTWQMTDAYIPDIEEMLAAEAPACRGALTDQSVSVDGTMIFTPNGMSHIEGSLSQSLSMVLTPACIKDFLSVETLELNQEICDGLATFLYATAQSPFDAATCDFVAGLCHCDAQQDNDIISIGPYSLPGNDTIVDANGIANPYCVQDNTLLIETTGNEDAVVQILLTR